MLSIGCSYAKRDRGGFMATWERRHPCLLFSSGFSGNLGSRQGCLRSQSRSMLLAIKSAVDDTHHLIDFE